MASRRDIFELMSDEARERGYGKDKPSLSDIQKQWRHYIPPQVVKEKYGSPAGQNEFSYVMYGTVLPRLYADKTNWIMQDEFGSQITSEDFASSLMSGFIPAKNEVGKSSALSAIQTYSPRPVVPGTKQSDNNVVSKDIDGIEQYVCPRCKSSFWAEAAGGPGPNPITIAHHPETDTRNQKSCGGGRHLVDPGDYPMVSSDGQLYESVVDDPFVKSENGKYYRYCGYAFNIKPFYSELYNRMKSVRSEDRRYRYAPTKGRRPTGTVKVYTCEHCNHPNYDYYEEVESPEAKKMGPEKAKKLPLEKRYPYSFQAQKQVACENCGKMINTVDPVNAVVYAKAPLVNLDKPVSTGEGEGGSLKNILRSLEEQGDVSAKELKEELWSEVLSLLREHFKSEGHEFYVDAFQEYFGIGQEIDPAQMESILSIDPEYNWCAEKAPKVGCREIALKYYKLRGHYTECLDCKNQMDEEATHDVFIKKKRKAGVPVEDKTRGAIIRCKTIQIGDRRNPKHTIPEDVIQKLADEVAQRQNAEKNIISSDQKTRTVTADGLFDDYEEVEQTPFEKKKPEESSETSLTTEDVVKQKQQEQIEHQQVHGRTELTLEEASLLAEWAEKDQRYKDLYQRYNGMNLRYHGKLDNHNDAMMEYNGGKITPYPYQKANKLLQDVQAYLRKEAQSPDSDLGEILKEILTVEEGVGYTMGE